MICKQVWVYYGMGNQMRLDPYKDMYSLFGMGFWCRKQQDNNHY